MGSLEKQQVLLSPADPRDYTVAAALEVSGDTLPDDFTVWQPPVEDQGNIGNCVAQALANIMECIRHNETGEHQDYSVGYIYGTTNTYGMMGRSACQVLVDEGDVPRSVWECLEENPECWEKRQSVGEDVKRQAKRALKYIRIKEYDDLKAFIYRYRLPVLLIAKSTKLQGGGNGRHAVACFGWQSPEAWRKKWGTKYPYEELRYTNSYGTGGGMRDGTGDIAFDDVEEIWGVVPMSEKKFPDVPENFWSTEAIYEAANDGIFEGYEDGTFRPKNNLTREEYAVMWQRMKRWIKDNLK